MKKNFAICLLCVFITTTAHAQFLKKIKDKVNKSVDKKIDKAVGIDKPTTETAKKEDAASDQYSDATENNERPIFVDKAPDNGRMILQLKKDDRFWGGYIQLKSQPKKTGTNATILDSLSARVGSFYTKGEISSYAIYFDGKRMENDSSLIPLRPEFINYQVNKTPYFLSTEAVIPPPSSILQGVAPTSGTFSFKWNGKSYGPFDGAPENMFVLRSMKDGKPTEKFYGFGEQMMDVGENKKGAKQFAFGGLIQTEKNVLRVKDYVLTTLAPTYPAGIMAFAQGAKAHTFSNGKTVAVIKIAGIADGINNVYTTDNKFYSEIYGTDSGHVVSIVKLKDITQAVNTTDAYIDYTTKLSYPVNIIKKNLLVASNPAKSVLYQMHTLYYPDGSKETIDNVGDAQIINFNGKDYIVWFEMMKVAEGHHVYICQKELK